MTDIAIEDEIELAPAEDSPWGKFLLETIRLDIYYEKSLGWHWFCAFRDLSDLDLKQIQQKLPEQHPFKSKTPTQSFLVPELTDALLLLKNTLKIIGNIEKIDFSGLRFKYFDFSYFVFPIEVSFQRAVFSQSVKFVKTGFAGNANFRDAKFLSSADFSDSIFSSSADFKNVIFSNSVCFHWTTFSNNTSFSGVKFCHAANFYNANFCSFTYFSNATFFIGANFSDAIFSHCALFDDVKITGHTTFKNAEFKQYPPSFQKANLYSDIILDDISWPILNKKSDSIVVGQNKNSYENLASLMKNLDKYHDEHFFYRQEMRCRRWLEVNLFISLSYWFYEILADYGYGIERAFFWWFLHIFVGMILIAVATKNNFCLFPVSFANAHSFLFLKDGALSGCYKYFTGNLLFNAIWATQSILGIILLFFLLLTLRIRFRLK